MTETHAGRLGRKRFGLPIGMQLVSSLSKMRPSHETALGGNTTKAINT